MFISTKSQIWELDLIVAIAIFITVFFIFYTYTSDLADLQNDKMDLLIHDGRLVSDQLVSAGYPLNWDSDPGNAIFVGLTDGNKRIVPDKVTAAVNDLTYAELRKIFGINNDFYAFFLYKDNPTNVDGIFGFGKPGVDQNNITQREDPEDLVKIERLLFYDSKIISLEVYVW